MIPVSGGGGPRHIPPFQNINNSPLREVPSDVDLPSFLMLIGSENPLEEPPSPPRSPTPPVPQHPSVIFPLDEDGDESWELRVETPYAPSTAQDEIIAFGSWLDKPGEVIDSGRHDHRGWVLWKYKVNPQIAAHKDVLFTMGGAITGKGKETIDEVTGMDICSDYIHANMASGQMTHRLSAEDYGYTKEECANAAISDDDDVVPALEEGVTDDEEVSAAEEDASDAEEGASDAEKGAAGGHSWKREPKIAESKTEEQIMETHSDIRRAVQLGDIEATIETLNGHPVWRAKNGRMTHDILFSTGALPEATGASSPMTVFHYVGQVHSTMELAFWGVWTHDHGPGDHENYNNLCQGMAIRYRELS